MKATLTGLLYILLCFSTHAQDVKVEGPDYDKVKKEISDSSSSFYYPLLFKKYLAGDTAMSLDEKRYLYYGYGFHENYSPYGRSKLYDSLKPLLNKEVLEPADMSKVLMYTDMILNEFPFDLNALHYQVFASNELGEEHNYDRRIAQMGIIFDAIFSSGDGLKKKTAYHVIYTAHEYEVLNVLGFEFGGQQQLIDHYDYLKLVKNPQGIKGLYFDVSRSLNALRNLHE